MIDLKIILKKRNENLVIPSPPEHRLHYQKRHRPRWGGAIVALRRLRQEDSCQILVTRSHSPDSSGYIPVLVPTCLEVNLLKARACSGVGELASTGDSGCWVDVRELLES